MSNNELFNQNNQNNEQDNPLESLVGEGKKFDSVESLAKGKLEADRYIEELKQKLEGLEDTNSKLDNLLEKVGKSGESTSQNSTPAANRENSGEPVSTSTNALDTDSVEALVEQKIRERVAEDTKQTNLNTVRQNLEQKYGGNAPTIVQEKARELGMDMAELDALAANNPKAFLTLVDGGSTNTNENSLFKSSVNSDAFANKSKTIEKGWSHFEKIMKESKSKFYSPAVQAEINKIADEVGTDVFFNS